MKKESDEYVEVTSANIGGVNQFRKKKIFGRIKFGGEYTLYAFDEPWKKDKRWGKDWFRADCDDESIKIIIDNVGDWDKKIAVSVLYYREDDAGNDVYRARTDYFPSREGDEISIPLDEIRRGYNVDCENRKKCKFDIRIKDAISGKFYRDVNAPVEIRADGKPYMPRAPEPPTGVVIPP